MKTKLYDVYTHGNFKPIDTIQAKNKREAIKLAKKLSYTLYHEPESFIIVIPKQ